ncbi:MAG: type II secretion system minor pseudopilin GspI [Steroidobacteraceae bacterium]
MTSHPSSTQAGFTLIEVLAALVIVSLGMLAVIGAVGQTVNNATYLREKTIAHWVAMNKLTEVRLSNASLENTETNGDIEMAGSNWHWRMEVSSTDVDSMQRINIHVAPKDAGDDASIANISGFYGTAVTVNGNRVQWDSNSTPSPAANASGSASSSSSTN